MLTKSTKDLTVRLARRAVLFLVTWSGGLALFYAFGNAQDFQDSTQYLILTALALTALFAALLSFALLIIGFAYFVKKPRKRHLALIALALVAFIVALVLTLGSHVIIMLSRGL